MKKILIVSAVPEEQNCLKSSTSLDIVINTTGIGLINAALQMGKILSHQAFSKIIFIGTAGSKEKSIWGTVAIPNQTTYYDPDLENQYAYKPEIMADRFPLWLPESDFTENPNPKFTPPPENYPQISSKPNPVSLDSGLSYILGGTASSPLFITKSLQRFPKQIIPYDYENMEIAAVAAAAQVHKIPIYAFLGISNDICESAHEQWLRYRAIAEKNSCKFAEIFLRKISLVK